MEHVTPRTTWTRLIVISDAEPDDLIAVHMMLSYASRVHMDSAEILVIGCGRDPADAQHILQTICDCFYPNKFGGRIHVYRGAPSKNKKFEDVADVFPKRESDVHLDGTDTTMVPEEKTEIYLRPGHASISEKEAATDDNKGANDDSTNEATEVLVDFTNGIKPDLHGRHKKIDIVCLSTWRDLFLARDKMDWVNVRRVYISGGPDATGAPSFNLRSDPEAFKGLLKLFHSLGKVQMFGPLLYATSMRCNISCNEKTCPGIIQAIMNSTKPSAPYIQKWIQHWDKQLMKNSPDFAKTIPFLGRQFTPADLFPAVAWIADRERECHHLSTTERLLVTTQDENMIEVVPLPDKPEWFRLSLTAAGQSESGIWRVINVNMDEFEYIIKTCF